MIQPIHRNRRGVTLIELIISIAILGVVLGISALSLAGERSTHDTRRPVASRIRALRSAAILAGVPQSAKIDDSAGVFLVTALPDGRVVTDLPHVERLNGATSAGVR